MNLHVDELSLNIISELEKEPLIGTQAIADRFGVTKSKVATRLKRIESLDAAHVMASTSATAGGYVVYQVFVKVRGRPVAEAAAELGALDETMFICGLVGEDDLYVSMRAHQSRSQDSLLALFSNCEGISNIRIDTVFGTLAAKYSRISFDPNRNTLSVDERKRRLKRDLAEIPLDDLDLTIIAEMHEQGRCSLRGIAGDHGVTEGAVRYRVRNLREQDLLSIITAIEPSIKGKDTWSLLEIAIEPSALREFAAEFETAEWLEIIQYTSGATALTCMLLTEGRVELSSAIHAIRNHPAVREARPSLLADIYKIDTRWRVPPAKAY